MLSSSASLALCLSISLVSGAVWVFLIKLYQQRRRMAGLPGPPYHPILGHLLVAAKMSALLPSDVHPHHYWHYLKKTYGLGDFFYFDVWPVGPPVLIICAPDIADQVTVKQSLNKHPIVKTYLTQHLGDENMASANGPVWKKARTMYNPAFASQHLMTVISKIVDDVLVFHDVLSELAESRKVFEMEATAMKLSFDVIGRLVLGLGLNSQRSSDELVDAFRTQLHYLSSADTFTSPFPSWNPLRQLMIARNSRVIDRCLGRIIDSRFNELDTAGEKHDAKGKCILDKALHTRQADAKGQRICIDQAFRKSTIHQIRTFVFAGHDTISTTISMIFYFLSHNPVIREKACTELTSILGPGKGVAVERIQTSPHVLSKMIYNHAVIKEALRLFPPANTVRIGSPSVNITDSSGRQWPTHDWMVWPDSYVLGRDERYFPRADQFIPERYLPDSPFPPVPTGAWRAFERGPRDCIGSEFGMLEIKVVMALTLRDFKFKPAYEEGAPKVDGEKCYQMLFGSAKPKSGVPGRIQRVGNDAIENRID